MGTCASLTLYFRLLKHLFRTLHRQHVDRQLEGTGHSGEGMAGSPWGGERGWQDPSRSKLGEGVVVDIAGCGQYGLFVRSIRTGKRI